MLGDLTPYPAYKPTDLPWLGNVPEHWEVRRGKYLFGRVDERSSDGQEELLTVSAARGIVLRKTANVTMFKASSYVGYKLCWPGDLVVNSLWAWAHGLGVSNFHGIVSSAYGIYRPTKNGTVHPRYVHELVRSIPFQWELQVRSKGVWLSRLQLTDESFLDAPLPLPPFSDQAAIVRFLNYAEGRTRRYIGAKQRLVKLLEEQKQAIIHQAVTRGLNPDAPMKDSGVEWLREIPAHWEVKPLKHWASINAKTLSEQTDSSFEFNYIDIGTVSTGRLVGEPQKVFFADAPSRARRVLRAGDTIVSTVRTYLKAVWYVGEHNQNVIASTGFAVLTPRKVIEPEYFAYVIQSQNFVDRVSANSVGVSYPAIAETRLARLPIAMPPTITEQTKLVSYIRQEVDPLNKALETALQEIALLREYRARLIADVVTGKLDVRMAAAELSNEIEGSELLEEGLEELLEAQEIAEDANLDDGDNEGAA